MKLSKQAKEVLEAVKRGEGLVSELESRGFDQAAVNRAALELEEKGLAEVEEQESLKFRVTEEGREVLENGSPEYRLLEELEESGGKPAPEVNAPQVGIGKARERGWIAIESGEVSITEEGREVARDPLRLKLEEEDYDEELRERGLVESFTDAERRIVLTGKGEGVDPAEIEEEFDVEARTRTPRIGKKHFYRRIMDEARKVWLEMGFREMDGDYVSSSLMNFDALYTPQDHPAREMQDTFFLENPVDADLSRRSKLAGRVKRVHENGADTGSTGWGYDWSRRDSELNVLRTHTTAISAEKLYEIEEEDLPAKYFVLGRNFRNETVDRHHLAEFYQTDGIVVGKDLNFRNLKAYISEFFRKMGYDDFRLIPSYYPYTEMSVEVQVKDGDEWMGLGGAGMFRPEVTRPLLGFDATVLAWGLGIGRIAMGNASLEDIRELYRNDVKVLEETPAWRRKS